MVLRALLLIALAACGLSACKTKQPKSRASIYAGDGPHVHYHEVETAGGAVRTTHYR